MKNLLPFILVGIVVLSSTLSSCSKSDPLSNGTLKMDDRMYSNLKKGSDLSDLELLGKYIYFDKISEPGSMACADCHAPSRGFVGPIPAVAIHGSVYRGAVPQRFGNRKPPSAAYGGDSPVLYYDELDDVWIGGMFWDGRATGWTLGDPLTEQALGPFLNPVEQNNPDALTVLQKIAGSKYAPLWEKVWGAPLNPDPSNASGLYEQVGRSIAAYERSKEVSSFTSKFDAYLAGKAELTTEEDLGLDLFNGKAMCSACHLSEGNKPLFTDFTYDNLGVPKNPLNPFYNSDPGFIDPGLGGFLESAGYSESEYLAQWGKQKVPTLRNVDKRPGPGYVKDYSHNGYFKSLKEIVHFYNTRDVDESWPEPEVAMNVNSDELGNLGLTDAEENAIVAFMKTLSDGYFTK